MYAKLYTLIDFRIDILSLWSPLYSEFSCVLEPEFPQPKMRQFNLQEYQITLNSAPPLETDSLAEFCGYQANLSPTATGLRNMS
jgi:hypothetical protein